MVYHWRRHSPSLRWMPSAANASRRLLKKCRVETSRTLCRNEHLSTQRSKSCGRAFASFQGCSPRDDERDRIERVRRWLNIPVLLRGSPTTTPKAHFELIAPWSLGRT